MKRVIVALVTASAMWSVRDVVAQCAMPGTLVSPANGAILPPSPTIYAFLGRAEDKLVVTRNGMPVPFMTRGLAHVQAWDVVSVTIDVPSPGPIEVTYADERPPMRYTIAAAAPVDHATLVASETVDDEWSCSFTRGVQLDVVGDAVAYRLDVAADVTALRHGRYRSAFLYPRPSELRTAGAPAALVIGHLSCRGLDLPDDLAIDDGGYARLVAIFADGREHAEELGYLRISDRTIEPPDWYEGMLSLDPDALPRARPAPSEPSYPWFALGTSALAGAASMLVLIALFARRRRARGVVGRL